MAFRNSRRIIPALAAILVLFALVEAAPANTPPEVTGVTAAQREGSQLVDISYDLADADGDLLTVTALLSIDGGDTWAFVCNAVTGDVGEGVAPGTGKAIVWDAGVDHPDFSSALCRIRIVADDGVPAPFVPIPAGTFTMGSPADEAGRDPGEVQREITLSRAIVAQRCEVTNRQFMVLAEWAVAHGYATATSYSLRDALDGSTRELLDLDSPNCEIDFVDGAFSCRNPDFPVQEVTWFGAVACCDWLSMQEGLTRAYDHADWRCNDGDPYAAEGYRLPTEAEWEHLCRAGTTTAFHGGGITQVECADSLLDGLGWYCGNAEQWSHAVGGKSPNAWGLLDVHGNVWEWCNDIHEPYPPGAATDPATDGLGANMVIRGGHSRSYASYCRSAARLYATPFTSDYYIGLRPVRTLR